MPKDHIPIEAMRAYLLGTLSDDEAAALEQEYFVNRSLFLRIQSEETALIEDYLDGKLSPADKQRFEGRYLQIPDLQHKMAEVRSQRVAIREEKQPPVRFSWRLAVAAALVVGLALGIWLYRSRISQPELRATGQLPTGVQSPVQPPATEHTLAAILLSPGHTKGSGSTSVQLKQPAPGSTVHLILELPGQASSVQRSVRISVVKPDESRELVWNSPGPLMSVAFRTPDSSYSNSSLHHGGPLGNSPGRSQMLSLSLPAAIFNPGDYVIETWTTTGRTHETYVYRVTER